MDEFRKRLEENAEEADFALMLDDYLNDMGDSLQQKYEEAKQNGEAPDMPEDMKNRLRQLISNYSGPVEETVEAETPQISTSEKPVNKLSVQYTRKWIRRLGVAAATIAILVGTLFTAQAAGLDVFGSISRWTDSIFYYERTSPVAVVNSKETTDIDQLKYAVLSQGLPQVYAPSWLPDRFSLAELKAESNESFSTIQAIFISSTKERIIIEISDAKVGDDVWNEKTDGKVEILNIGNIDEKSFRVFQNTGNWTAVWSNGLQSISIYGNIELDELKEIINTMGEN